jgi:hypothetical protein
LFSEILVSGSPCFGSPCFWGLWKSLFLEVPIFGGHCFWESLFLGVLVFGSPCFWGLHTRHTPAHTHPGTHAPRHTRIPAHTHPGTHAPRHTRTPAHTHPGTHAHRHTRTPSTLLDRHTPSPTHNFNTFKCPPRAALAHVPSSQGHCLFSRNQRTIYVFPLSAAHCSRAWPYATGTRASSHVVMPMCQPLAAANCALLISYGHPCATAYFATSTWPPLAMAKNVASVHGHRPRSRAHLRYVMELTKRGSDKGSAALCPAAGNAGSSHHGEAPPPVLPLPC